MTDDHCAFLELYGDERIRRHSGKLYVFHDWMELTGYDSKTRLRLTAWSVAHRRTGGAGRTHPEGAMLGISMSGGAMSRRPEVADR